MNEQSIEQKWPNPLEMGQTVWNEFRHKEMSSAQADKFKYRKLQLKDKRLYPMGETERQLIEKVAGKKHNGKLYQ